MIAVRRLGPDDEPLLELLAQQDPAFDLEGRGSPRTPLSFADARAYLSDADVLHWVAEENHVAVGHLLSHVQRRRADGPFQVMLYEIGVRDGYRRRGAGRALITAVVTWMTEHRISTVWVLADNPGAEDFYKALGFKRDAVQPVQLSLTTQDRR